jgi:4,5-dihydroxyphthalate decarboxylase
VRTFESDPHGRTVTGIVAVVGAYPHTDALLAKPVVLTNGDSVTFNGFGSVAGGAGAAFARQARQLQGFDFDVSELPVVNYLSAKEHGAAFTALPVFLTRRFVQNMLIVDREAVRSPKDLEGRRVGLLYYGHSDSTWLRGILAERYGVDLSTIKWVTETEEQVDRAVLPPNVVHIPRTSIDEMLMSGEVAARITNAPRENDTAMAGNLGPMWPDTEATDAEWYAASGILPILHTLVVKSGLLEANPDLGPELYAAFRSARDEAVGAVEAGNPLPVEDLARARGSGFPTTSSANSPRPYLPHDPIPYGLEANRHSLETLVRMAHEMHVMQASPPLEEVFLPFD